MPQPKEHVRISQTLRLLELSNFWEHPARSEDCGDDEASNILVFGGDCRSGWRL